MPDGALRLATWNIEWFDALFDDDGRVLRDGVPTRSGVTRAAQAEAVARVLSRIDPDLLMVIEAPDEGRQRSTCRALEGFAATFGLRARRALIGFPNDTQQEIAALHDPDRLRIAHAPGSSPGAPRFDGVFHIDLDVDGRTDRVVFSKPPLEIDLDFGPHRLHLIGAHLKSKAPYGARSEADVLRLAIANRRKQLAQAIWLRARVDARLAEGRSVVVMGDLNDGPGLDEYEDLFGRSSVEIVLGEGAAALTDPHVQQALSARFAAPPTTSRFLLPDGRYLQTLLDYIMVSPDLAARQPRWTIWHPFDLPEAWRDPDLRDALLTASDHFPVSVDLPLGG